MQNMIAIIVYTSVFQGHSVPCLPNPTNNEYKQVSLGSYSIEIWGCEVFK